MKKFILFFVTNFVLYIAILLVVKTVREPHSDKAVITQTVGTEPQDGSDPVIILVEPAEVDPSIFLTVGQVSIHWVDLIVAALFALAYTIYTTRRVEVKSGSQNF